MIKTILIATLAAIVIGATGMSVYNAVAGTNGQAALQAAGPASVEQVNGNSWRVAAQEANSAVAAPVQAEAQVQTQAEAQVQTQAEAQVQMDAAIPVQENAQAQIYQATGQQPAAQDAGVSRGGRGNGRGGAGQRGANSNGTSGAAAVPDPQNGLVEWLTFHGTVSQYVPPSFVLLSDNGQSIPAQLGNQSYVASLGLALSDGDAVSITGYWDTSGSFSVGQITLDAGGATYSLRDDLGRPLWSGGPNR